ncbi:MAG: serine/threonine protein kinase [Micrococcales bacterium]|nr:serine/threonine protein kinase [Micrococcales bacterium]
MTRRRQPSTPPDLPGYSYSRLLGMGGFADVFLYRQELPIRDVAVKVLLASHLGDDAREQFVTEANLMAQVSQHPAIVTVHHAGFADDGRPYLVMEYCSRPGVAERYRTERMGVAECLRIAIRIASAVASAHEAGIWHRDIKPANVLTTDFGWPALTDFGIAATAALAGSAAGMSIPWAPPELLSPSPSGDERSDVYSLAATLYSMLAGRSPFEVLGTANSASDLVGRIERMPLPRISRDDVPDELFEVLDTAMARRVADRHPSAIAFARDLQGIEADLGLPVTVLDLVETEPEVTGTPEVQADTWVPLDQVDGALGPQTDEPVVETSLPAEAPVAEVPVVEVGSDPDDDEIDETTRSRDLIMLGAEPDEGRYRDSQVEVPEPATDVDPAARRTRRRIDLVAVGTLVLVVVAVAVAATLGRTSDAGTRPSVPRHVEVSEPRVEAEAVPAPGELVGTVADGAATFTWTNPKPAEGDRYRWVRVELGGTSRPAFVDDPSVVVPLGPDDGPVCIEVLVMRADGRLSVQSATGCAQ